ncbi:MAG: aldehyde dehydrogenase family protein [Pseudonocardiaceae bacterium]
MTGAFISGGSVKPAAGVGREAVSAAAELEQRGMAAGDRALLIAANSPEFVLALLALIHLDVSIVLVDPRQTQSEIERLAAVSRASWALVGTSGELPTDLPVNEVQIGALFAEMAPDAGGKSLSFAAWAERADALIVWSSGSTGLPKGVVRSGRSLLINTEQTCERMGYRETDVMIPFLPFSHQYGFSVVLTWWAAGCSLVLAPYSRVDLGLRLAAQAGATVVDAAPSTYHTILNLSERHPELLAGLDRVRMWCVGGAPLDPSLADRFSKEFGLPLLDGYGSTEAGNIALAAPDNPVGCGRPLDGVELQIIDDDGKPVGTGKTGEIVVQSLALMEGYLPPDGDGDAGAGAFRTNDLGYLDADGNLYVVGRKFAIHRLGHTIYPEALERRASACGRPVVVVPLEDQRRGSQLIFVVADPAGGEPRHWRSEIAALLPSYEHPNHVIVVDRIPVNRNGKPDMARLRAMAAEGLAPRMARAATDAGAGMAAVPLEERIQALRYVLEFLRAQPREVVDVLTEISVHRAVVAEIESACAALEGAVEEILTYGPGRVARMAVFMPSNVLLYSYVLYLLVPALYTDRLTARPATVVASQLRRLHEVLAPVHRLPVEVGSFSQQEFLDGPVTAADVVVFTGAYANAEQVRSRLRDDQLFVFFGQGINPFIVGPDADLGQAVTDALRVRLLNSGQDCFGPDVLFVHDSVRDPFLKGLTKALQGTRFGDNRDPEADYGGLWYDTAVEEAAAYLHRHRGHIVHGGAIDFRTRRVEPTLLVRDWARQLPITEFFSPIFHAVTYTEAEQLHHHVRSPFFSERAMGAMVYGGEPKLLELLRRRHLVAVNATLMDVENGNRPFGGHGVMANYLMCHGRRSAEPLLISKAVAEHLPGSRAT